MFVQREERNLSLSLRPVLGSQAASLQVFVASAADAVDRNTNRWLYGSGTWARVVL